MKYGSLFSGVGGFDLGFDRAGMECAWQVEKDEFCRKVLTKHWPDVPKFEDVHDVGQHNLEIVDLICGGFPCQPFAHVGKQRGMEDERWLWPEFYRIVREIRPRWVVIENVPGLLTTGNGEAFAQILRDLSEIGFDAEWEIIQAQDFGAPHKRARLFIVAHAPLQPERQALQSISAERTRKKTRESNADLGWREMATPDWEIPPSFVVREIDGLPGRVDRSRALGNAVVPQVAEWIGRRIMEVA